MTRSRPCALLLALLLTSAPALAQDHVVSEQGGGSLEVYLPTSAAPLDGHPTIVVVPGLRVPASNYTGVRRFLVRRGFAVAVFSWDDNSDTDADRWEDRLTAATEELRAESDDVDSDLYGEIDVDRMGLLGHSLGGAVATLAAARDDRYRALAVFGPNAIDQGFLREARDVTAATISIDGSLDFVAKPDETGGVVVDRADTDHKAHIVIKDAGHLNAPQDENADYVQDTPRSTWKWVPYWPFWVMTYEVPIVPDLVPLSGPKHRRIAFGYLGPWFDRFVAGEQPSGETLAERAVEELGEEVLSEASFSGPLSPPAASSGLIGGLR